MEVHAHTHTPRKKWTHYFWEFLMLFLAVFCGFLAEYQLEHKIEKDRERQYIVSLVKDLEYDTLQFQKTLDILQKKMIYYDSVFLFFRNPSSYNDHMPFRYYFITSLEQFYTPAKPTIEQLKGSGNLRIIRKQLALDSILIYDSRLGGSYNNQTQFVIEANKRLIHSFETIFDLTNFDSFITDRFTNTPAQNSSVYDLGLMPVQKVAIQEVYNVYISTKASDFFYIQVLKATKKLAASLIIFLKKEYHLK